MDEQLARFFGNLFSCDPVYILKSQIESNTKKDGYDEFEVTKMSLQKNYYFFLTIIFIFDSCYSELCIQRFG